MVPHAVCCKSMFEWDDGNLDHIARHGVESWEVEEAFGDRHRIRFQLTVGDVAT